MHRLAEKKLVRPGVEPGDFIQLLQAMQAFEGDCVWGRRLDRPAGRGYSIEGLACDAPLYLEMTEGVAVLDDGRTTPDRWTPLVPHVSKAEIARSSHSRRT